MKSRKVEMLSLAVDFVFLLGLKPNVNYRSVGYGGRRFAFDPTEFARARVLGRRRYDDNIPFATFGRRPRFARFTRGRTPLSSKSGNIFYVTSPPPGVFSLYFFIVFVPQANYRWEGGSRGVPSHWRCVQIRVRAFGAGTRASYELCLLFRCRSRLNYN